MNLIPNSIALLIDADNAPAAKIDFIMSELAGHGVVNIRRAYGNWKKQGLAGWEKVLHEYSIQPVQMFDQVKGKNATDIALVIDAMDLLYTKQVTTFCLVTSDCDFTPLCQRLRADGKQVFGFGGKQTPHPFVESCTSFFYLDREPKPEEPDQAGQKPARELQDVTVLTKDTELINRLRGAVKALAAEGEQGWANLSSVRHRLKNITPVDHRSFGFKKLSDLFAATGLFEVKMEKTGTEFVRLKQGTVKKLAKKAPAKTAATKE
jgi:uncharacterized LabA/DUF88 family protein